MATDKPRAQRIVEAARDYITKNVLPQEAMVSIPVPARRDGRLVAILFATITIPEPDLTNRWVFRPPVRIIVDWDNVEVIGHEDVPDIVPIDQDRPVGLLYQPEFAGRPSQELSDRIWAVLNEIFSVLDRVAPLYDRRDLSAEERALVSRIDRALHRWITPDIWPLYLELNPAFFQWIEEVRAPDTLCSSCVAANPPGSRFCRKCGAPLRNP